MVSSVWPHVPAETHVSTPALLCSAHPGPYVQVSGVPILEKTADERWGNEAVYQSYKSSTPCLVPKLPGMARVD